MAPPVLHIFKWKTNPRLRCSRALCCSEMKPFEGTNGSHAIVTDCNEDFIFISNVVTRWMITDIVAFEMSFSSIRFELKSVAQSSHNRQKAPDPP